MVGKILKLKSNNDNDNNNDYNFIPFLLAYHPDDMGPITFAIDINDSKIV